jgi:hypothetical protein
LLLPVSLEQNRRVAPVRVGRIALPAEAELRVLQLRTDAGWIDLYAFTLEAPLPRRLRDGEITIRRRTRHPRFVQTLTAQRSAT